MTATLESATRALSRHYLAGFPDRAAAKVEALPDDDAVEILVAQPDPVVVALLSRVSPQRAGEIAIRLPPERAATFLAAVDPAIAARAVAPLEPEPRAQLLAPLPRHLARELEELISYPPEVAGAIMEARFLSLHPESRVREALAVIRATRNRPREQVFVVDDEGRLLGRVRLAELVVADADDTLLSRLEPVAVTIGAMEPRDEVADLLDVHRLTSLPVVDAENRLVGVIRQEALLAASREEMLGDLQTMVGASREERAFSQASFAIRKRLPWLEINLVTAFLAAAVVGLFEETIARVTALAVLLPVVAGQSGNTGAQALAVTMRGLALREVRVRQWPRVLWKESRVGFVNGLAVALTTSFFVYLWSRSEGLAMVIGLSMVLSMTLAGIAGGAIPLLLSALRQDPAQSSSIILTTVTDVVGFFSFLGIATLLASRL